MEPSHDVGLPPALYDLQGIATVFGSEGTATPPWKHGYVRLFPLYAGSDARLFNSV